MARFRNRLVHIYWDVSDNEIYRIMGSYPASAIRVNEGEKNIYINDCKTGFFSRNSRVSTIYGLGASPLTNCLMNSR
ncbi:MAG: hypothetical protein B6U89_05350 [Desulfurococcales archaeon ex4484_58]|nr:MAG: hypothetical protein B6U89_05350 [Desulfurococcales archaeon ex4484_58]